MHDTHRTKIDLVANTRRRRAARPDPRQGQGPDRTDDARAQSRLHRSSPEAGAGLDAVDLSSFDSFPASDAPGWVY